MQSAINERDFNQMVTEADRTFNRGVTESNLTRMGWTLIGLARRGGITGQRKGQLSRALVGLILSLMLDPIMMSSQRKQP